MGGPAGLSILSCSKILSPPDSVTPKHLGRVGLTTFYLLLHKPYHTVRRVGLTTTPPNTPPKAPGRQFYDHAHLVQVCPFETVGDGNLGPTSPRTRRRRGLPFRETEFSERIEDKRIRSKCSSTPPLPHQTVCSKKEPGKIAQSGKLPVIWEPFHPEGCQGVSVTDWGRGFSSRYED